MDKVKKFPFHVVVLLCAALAMGVVIGENAVSVFAAGSISLNNTSLTLNVGSSKTLKVKGTSKKVTWKSSNKKIATVTAKGKVKAKKEGTAKITAKVKGKKKKLSCRITVVKKKSMPEQVVAIVNKERKKRGLSKVKLDSKLNKAAQKRAKEISRKFDHTRPNGENCFTVFSEYGISYLACGENIAAGQPTAKDVMSGWMQSEGHKRNILSENYNKLGVGYYKKQGSDYTYYWVQLFTD